MKLITIDWSIIAAYFVLSLVFALVYSVMFGIGELIFGVWSRVLLFGTIATVSAVFMIWNLNRTAWVGLAEGSAPKIPEVVGEGAD